MRELLFSAPSLLLASSTNLSGRVGGSFSNVSNGTTTNVSGEVNFNNNGNLSAQVGFQRQW